MVWQSSALAPPPPAPELDWQRPLWAGTQQPSTLCGIPGAVAAWEPTGHQLKVQDTCAGGISPLALEEMNVPQLSSNKL